MLQRPLFRNSYDNQRTHGSPQFHRSWTMLIGVAIGILSLVSCSSATDVNSSRQEVNDTPSSAGSSKPADSAVELASETMEPEPPMVEAQDADLRVLFLGNSHTSSHHMYKMVAALANLDEDSDKMFADLPKRGGAFLVDHLANEQTVELIKNGNWDVVVLQGQKYSTTGKYTYPTDASKTLTRIAKESGARVVMFPEWRRRGHDAEGKRVHRLHESIAEESGADVSPVGLAWDAAFESKPELVLHAPDGNHCNARGAYLTACTLYCSITGRNPEGIDYRARIRMTDEERAFLQRIAWETYTKHNAEDE